MSFMKRCEVTFRIQKPVLRDVRTMRERGPSCGCRAVRRINLRERPTKVVNGWVYFGVALTGVLEIE